MLALLMGEVNEDGGLRGWLGVLCIMLLGYHPLSFAVVAASWLSALGVRGASLALVLVARLAVTGLGVAAGFALLGARPGAAPLALVAMALSGTMDIFIYSTSYVPNNRMPGDTPFYIAASLAYHGAWIAYLLRSKRVRNLSS